MQNTQRLKPNDKAGRGETCRNLGIVHQNSSSFHEVIEYHECDLQTTKEGGDKAGQEQAYGNLSNWEAKLGKDGLMKKTWHFL